MAEELKNICGIYRYCGDLNFKVTFEVTVDSKLNITVTKHEDGKSTRNEYPTTHESYTFIIHTYSARNNSNNYSFEHKPSFYDKHNSQDIKTIQRWLNER